MTNLQPDDLAHITSPFRMSNREYFTHWPPVQHREYAATSQQLRTLAHHVELPLGTFAENLPLQQPQAAHTLAMQSSSSLPTAETETPDFTDVASRELPIPESHPSYNRIGVSPSSSSPAPQKRDSKYFCTHCPGEFKWKGDWKRHEAHKHEHQDVYTCEPCPQVASCTRGPYYTKRDFDRHHKKAHKCHSCPKTDACRRELPKKRAWGCGFCFQALLTWDERIDHIAQHYEEGKKASEWDYSSVILSLLLQPSMIDVWKSAISARFGIQSGQWLTCRWSQENTKHLLAGLEGDCQDLENLAAEALDLAQVKFADPVTQSTDWIMNTYSSFPPTFVTNHGSHFQPSYTDSSDKTNYPESAFIATPSNAPNLAMLPPTNSHYAFPHRNDIYQDSPSPHYLATSQWPNYQPEVDPDRHRPQKGTSGLRETERKKILQSQAQPKFDRGPNSS